MFSVVFISISTNLASFESSSRVDSEYAVNPGSLRLYRLLRRISRAGWQRSHTPGTPPTGSLPNLQHTPTFQTPKLQLHFSLEISIPLVPGLGTRLAKRKTRNYFCSSAAHSHVRRKCVRPLCNTLTTY